MISEISKHVLIFLSISCMETFLYYSFDATDLRVIIVEFSTSLR